METLKNLETLVTTLCSYKEMLTQMKLSLLRLLQITLPNWRKTPPLLKLMKPLQILKFKASQIKEKSYSDTLTIHKELTNHLV